MDAKGSGQLSRLMRTYAVLSAVNRLIVRERDQQRLLDAACEIAVTQGRFPLAWIGLLDEGRTRLALRSRAGARQQLLTELPDAIDVGETGRGPAAEIMRTGKRVLIEDFATDAASTAWSAKLADHGLRSGVALPIASQSRVVGVFSLYADVDGAFDAEELQLLEEMVDDIGFALEHQRQEAEREQADLQHRAAERTSRLLVEFAPAAIAIFDREMRYMAASARFLQDYRVAEADIVGRSHYDVFPEIPESIREVHRRSLAGEIISSDDDMFPRADGTIDWVRWAVHPWYDEQGSVGGIVLFSEVTTAQKNAQIEVERLAVQRQLALDAAHLGWWRYDPMSGVSSHDERSREIFGVAGAALPSDEVFGRMNAEDVPRVRALIEQALDAWSPPPPAIAFRITRAPGDERWIEAHGIGVFEGDGGERRATAFVGTVEDVTAERIAAEEFRFRQVILETQQEASPDGILVVDAGGTVLSASRRFREQWGMPDDIVGGPNNWVLTQATQLLTDPDGFIDRVRDVYDHPAKTSKDIITLRDGRVLERNSAPMTEPDGSYLGRVWFFRDITDRERAREQLLQQLQRLSALRDLDMAIRSGYDLHVTLDAVLDQVMGQLGMDAASMFLLDDASGDLVPTAARGFTTDHILSLHIPIGEGFSGVAAAERRTIAILDLAEAERPAVGAAILRRERFVSLFAVPLLAKGEVRGVLAVLNRTRLDPSPEWLAFLEVLAGHAAIAIDEAQLLDSLQRSKEQLEYAYDATIRGWSRAMDLRDRDTEGHTERVTALTVLMAREAGMSAEEIVHLRRGALLHDMGKLGVPDGILTKPGKLDEEEWALMKMHPRFVYDMLSSIEYLRPAMDIPYCHHERWDGTGYPRGIAGEEIPLAARLFAVVDVWDALRSDRPYSKAWSAERALEHIRGAAGSHFDPDAVALFFRVLEVQTDQEWLERRS